MLSHRQRVTLLKVARESVQAAAAGQSYRPPETEDTELLRPAAVFVTLNKEGQLRGCIGTVEARQPMIEAVAELARSSAAEDPRFPPVRPAEVVKLDIDISVLTPAQRVKDVSEIEIGTHGLIIQDGHCRGLLLPQVATDWGWDCEEFLDHCCLKAGLEKGHWRNGGEIYSFTAEVFGEEQEGVR
jgi:AmmeMemoRadiSam system protein A